MKYALIALLLSGCASLPAGVEMTEDERKACEEHGCTVWTRAELEHLVRLAMQRGYAAGRQSL
jgi:starvation-inducible outer membrane lipoprotein